MLTKGPAACIPPKILQNTPSGRWKQVLVCTKGRWRRHRRDSFFRDNLLPFTNVTLPQNCRSNILDRVMQRRFLRLTADYSENLASDSFLKAVSFWVEVGIKIRTFRKSRKRLKKSVVCQLTAGGSPHMNRTEHDGDYIEDLLRWSAASKRLDTVAFEQLLPLSTTV